MYCVFPQRVANTKRFPFYQLNYYCCVIEHPDKGNFGKSFFWLVIPERWHLSWWEVHRQGQTAAGAGNGLRTFLSTQEVNKGNRKWGEVGTVQSPPIMWSSWAKALLANGLTVICSSAANWLSSGQVHETLGDISHLKHYSSLSYLSHFESQEQEQ